MRAADPWSSMATAGPCRPARRLETQVSSGQSHWSCTHSRRRGSARGRENSGRRGCVCTGNMSRPRREAMPRRTLIPPPIRRWWLAASRRSGPAFRSSTRPRWPPGPPRPRSPTGAKDGSFHSAPLGPRDADSKDFRLLPLLIGRRSCTQSNQWDVVSRYADFDMPTIGSDSETPRDAPAVRRTRLHAAYAGLRRKAAAGDQAWGLAGDQGHPSPVGPGGCHVEFRAQ